MPAVVDLSEATAGVRVDLGLGKPRPAEGTVMADPVFRTILLFDIEQFGSRDDVEQAFLRRILFG